MITSTNLFSIAVVLSVCAIIATGTEESTNIENVLHTTAVNKLLLSDIMPNIKLDTDKECDVWETIEYISVIKDLGERANETAGQLPTDSTLNSHLLGFKAIIDEVMIDACNWLNSVLSMDPELPCSSGDFIDGLENLLAQVRLYRKLSKTEETVKKNIEDSQCSQSS